MRPYGCPRMIPQTIVHREEISRGERRAAIVPAFIPIACGLPFFEVASWKIGKAGLAAAVNVTINDIKSTANSTAIWTTAPSGWPWGHVGETW